VMFLAFSPDSALIVSGSSDNVVCVWDAHSGIILSGPFSGRTRSVSSLSFSPNSIHIASGSWDGTIIIWDARNGSLVAGPLKGHVDAINSVAYSTDGNRLVSGSQDHTVRVWDVQSMISTDPGPFENWSPDKDGWIVGSGGELLLWVRDDLRLGLGNPRNPLVICPPGTPQIELDTLLLSDYWRERFIG
jgi:WD40 repeat protein